jgi:hypothetical protein
MKRRIRISLIELGRKQRVTAAAMLNVARQECTTAEAMYDASERMRKAARGAVVDARRQLSGPCQSKSRLHRSAA